MIDKISPASYDLAQCTQLAPSEYKILNEKLNE
jgi:hypothetical protein